MAPSRRGMPDRLAGSRYSTIDSRGRQAIFDFVGRGEQLALRVDGAVRSSLQDGWRDNPFKIKLVRQGIASVITDNEVEVEEILELVKAHGEY